MVPAASSGLLSLISAAVTPVVLITAAAILLSGFASKYGNISDQMRRLTAEYRNGETSKMRRNTIARQLAIFSKRINAIWTACTCLCLAILSYLIMVLAVLFAAKAVRLGVVGIASLLVGLGFMVAAMISELFELRLARATAACEIRDTLQGDQAP